MFWRYLKKGEKSGAITANMTNNHYIRREQKKKKIDTYVLWKFMFEVLDLWQKKRKKSGQIRYTIYTWFEKDSTREQQNNHKRKTSLCPTNKRPKRQIRNMILTKNRCTFRRSQQGLYFLPNFCQWFSDYL